MSRAQTPQNGLQKTWQLQISQTQEDIQRRGGGGNTSYPACQEIQIEENKRSII